MRTAAEGAGARATEQPSLEQALLSACCGQGVGPSGRGAVDDGRVLRVLCGSLHLVADFRKLVDENGSD